MGRITTISLFALLSWVGSPDLDLVEIGYSQDRCSMQGCMAEVYAPPLNQLPQFKNTKRKSFYFKENSAELTDEGKEAVSNFAESGVEFVIVGYTDSCGSYTFNYNLSMFRSKEVARIIRRKNPRAKIKISWFGELTGGHNWRNRRVDVFAGLPPLTKVYPPLIADYYLLDASGSMSGKWQSWVNAVRYWKPRTSRVYVSTTGYYFGNTNILDVRPSGGTEIFYSVWSIIDKMPRGSSLIVVSDFGHNVAPTVREVQRLKDKMNAKGIQVYSVFP